MRLPIFVEPRGQAQRMRQVEAGKLSMQPGPVGKSACRKPGQEAKRRAMHRFRRQPLQEPQGGAFQRARQAPNAMKPGLRKPGLT